MALKKTTRRAAKSSRPEAFQPGRVKRNWGLSISPWIRTGRGPSLPPAAAAPPHLIQLVIDDFGYADTSVHVKPAQPPDIPTPHLRTMADDGVRLSHLYVQPVCSPCAGRVHGGRVRGAGALGHRHGAVHRCGHTERRARPLRASSTRSTSTRATTGFDPTPKISSSAPCRPPAAVGRMWLTIRAKKDITEHFAARAR